MLGALLGCRHHGGACGGPPRCRGPGVGPALKSVRVVYAATVTGGELAREVDGTTDEARWIPLADVPSLTRVSLVDVALGYPRP